MANQHESNLKDKDLKHESTLKGQQMQHEAKLAKEAPDGAKPKSSDSTDKLAKTVSDLAEHLKRPRRLVRDDGGKLAGIE